MNETFAAKVYPVISHVLDLHDQIQQAAGSEPTPREIFPRLKQLVGSVEADGSDKKAMELAKRALVYWVDEVLVNSNWAHATEWQNSTLEREIYDTRDRAWKFFDAARSARAFGRSDALETFYLCVALGFRGIYRDGSYVAEPTPQESSGPPKKEDAPPPSLTWFGDTGQFNPEDTWGLGNLPNMRMDESGFDSQFPGQFEGPAENSYGLPRTLEEWAGPVFAQVAPPVNENFVPALASETQRDARPLRSKQSFQRTVQILIASVLVTLLLFVAWLFLG